MLLYVCPTCGRWQDAKLGEIINNALANISRSLNQQPPEQLGYPCPVGHGLMVWVKATDRVYVRTGEVEALEEISKDVSALP
jgi:hypothetical protein